VPQLQKISPVRATIMVWLFAVLFADAIICTWLVYTQTDLQGIWGLFVTIVTIPASLVAGLPAFAVLYFVNKAQNKKTLHEESKVIYLYLAVIIIAVAYASPAFLFEGFISGGLYYASRIAAALFAGGLLSLLVNRKLLNKFLNPHIVNNTFSLQQITNPMFTDDTPVVVKRPVNPSNKILIKGIITAALILIMLIPTAFIQSLITERQERQSQVVNEVSSKWAKPQVVSAPYLVIPYAEGKSLAKKQLIVLPEQLNVNGKIIEEDRTRSIYKVMLYKTALSFTGSFHISDSNIGSSTLLLNEAKLCFGLSDFRGIEDKLTATLGSTAYTLMPGLPNTTIDSTGLSVPVTIDAASFNKGISFSINASLKGSGSLHFLPIGAYNDYDITSPWPNPSFDGNTLPANHAISGTGFAANWKFNAANLALPNVIKDEHINIQDDAFGVSLVQPAGQYGKSMRSAKYAILIIGLTFVLFFVFELLQKRPVHPVQYALIGMALVIFYTLLLSISEIILFEYAYSIAAVATILLIALYAKSHFNNWRSPGIIGLLLTGLYGFIYVLISLEDTALLVGSIALFIVVAIIMYVTRKVNWYQPEQSHATINFQP